MSLEMYKRYLTEPGGLVEGGIVRAIWHPDGNQFCFCEGEPHHTIFYRVNPEKNTKEVMFDPIIIRAKMKEKLGFEPPYEGLPFGQFAFIDENTIAFSIDDRVFGLNVESLEISQIADNSMISEIEKQHAKPGKFVGFFGVEAEEIPSPDGSLFLGVKDHNLYLRHAIDGRIDFITSNGNEVHQWMHIGLKWSLDRQCVIAKFISIEGVPRLPVVHWLKTDEEVQFIPFPKAGEKSFGQTLFMIDILSKEQVQLDTLGEKYEYINFAGWSPDNKYILYATTDREFKYLDLWRKDLKNGQVSKLLTENDEKFLNYDPFDSPPLQFIDNGGKFLWISERDGWNHIYLYDISGKMIQQLTKGEYPIERVVDIDEQEGWVYFTGYAEPELYETNLYRVKLDGTDFQRVTPGGISHYVQLSPSKKFVIDTCTTPADPPISYLRNVEGKNLQTLTEMNIEEIKVELGWREPEKFIVKADDGNTDLVGYIFKPHDFNPEKKYGVIDYIYNGPHACIVPTAFLPGAMKVFGIKLATGYNGDIHEALAQLGYVVVVTDGRGSSNRGKLFQEVSYGNLGHYELKDHIAVIKQLATERTWMDIERVGITGYSYGGYMTLYAMMNEPDFFKVGVAAAPIPDLFSGSLYAEHYMGLPQNNREGYKNGSCVEKATNLKGKLLILAGTNDTNAFFSGIMKMVAAFANAGKPYDLIILPEQTHLYDGKSAIYYLERMGEYFQEHL